MLLRVCFKISVFLSLSLNDLSLSLFSVDFHAFKCILKFTRRILLRGERARKVLLLGRGLLDRDLLSLGEKILR